MRFDIRRVGWALLIVTVLAVYADQRYISDLWADRPVVITQE